MTDLSTAPPHVTGNSGNNHWYTPEKFTTSARLVMGAIDLDPASCIQANKTVKAMVIYTQEMDGLDRDWFGRVWMNPPYSQPLIRQFSQKLVDSYEGGEVTEAITLVNNGTETAWFKMLARSCSALCFPGKRIKFIDQEDKASGSPLQGQAIIYHGHNINGFLQQFSQYGMVVAPLKHQQIT